MDDKSGHTGLVEVGIKHIFNASELGLPLRRLVSPFFGKFHASELVGQVRDVLFGLLGVISIKRSATLIESILEVFELKETIRTDLI